MAPLAALVAPHARVEPRVAAPSPRPRPRAPYPAATDHAAVHLLDSLLGIAAVLVDDEGEAGRVAR